MKTHETVFLLYWRDLNLALDGLGRSKARAAQVARCFQLRLTLGDAIALLAMG